MLHWSNALSSSWASPIAELLWIELNWTETNRLNVLLLFTTRKKMFLNWLCCTWQFPKKMNPNGRWWVVGWMVAWLFNVKNSVINVVKKSEIFSLNWTALQLFKFFFFFNTFVRQRCFIILIQLFFHLVIFLVYLQPVLIQFFFLIFFLIIHFNKIIYGREAGSLRFVSFHANLMSYTVGMLHHFSLSLLFTLPCFACFFFALY